MAEAFRQFRLFGVAGEFTTVDALLEAARATESRGMRRVEAYTPFPVEEVSEILHQHNRPVALITLIAGMLGALTGFGMCWYANVLSYPINIGGRPDNSWPAWIPITFELTVLFAALTSAIGMLGICGLPRLHHPMFNVEGFDRASRDRFFLCIEAKDAKFNATEAMALLKEAGAVAVSEVAE